MDPLDEVSAEPTPSEPVERPRSVGTVALVAVGIVAGMVVGLVAAWALGGDGPADAAVDAVPAPRLVVGESPEAAEAFLAAWTRSRTATYVAVTDWHRVTDVGAELRQVRVVAQRPPDRVLRTGGSLAGVADGVRYTCDEVDADVACQAVPDPRADEHHDAAAEREAELMWRHLEGTNPLYRVSVDDEGCYLLRLARAMPAPPYGVRSTFCFDEASGAVARFRIERTEGTDTEVLRWVDTEVTDDDLVAVVEGSLDLTRRAP